MDIQAVGNSVFILLTDIQAVRSICVLLWIMLDQYHGLITYLMEHVEHIFWDLSRHTPSDDMYYLSIHHTSKV
jgi:hypothetical protein